MLDASWVALHRCACLGLRVGPVTLDSTTIFASDRDILVFLVDDLHPIKIGTVVNPRTDQLEAIWCSGF